MVRGRVALVMAVDLTTVPWDRLAKLAPPGTPGTDIQAAADRYSLTTDLYAAAADLWEEAANAINLQVDETPSGGDRPIKSVTQDGISVTYADSPIGDTQATRI